MEYTQKEKEIARAIVSNHEYCELIAKIFLETEDKLTTEVIQSKTNSELGEIVRADRLAEDKIKLRWAKLKQLGQEIKKVSSKVPS